MNTTRDELAYEFEGFRLDVNERCLKRNGEVVPLTAKAFDTLLVLVENQGRLVEKDTLMERVWADTFVEESTLAQNISTLRKAFSAIDDEARFIETIPKRGYRFLPKVQQLSDLDDLYVVETRTSTRVLAEQTEIRESIPKLLASRIQQISTSYPFVTIAAIGATLLLFAAAAVFVGNYYFSEGQRFEKVSIRTLVSRGNIQKVTISPDGKQLALVEEKNGLQSLVVRQTSAANDIEIVPPSKKDFVGITFAPDGESIYYTAYEPSDDPAANVKTGKLNKIATLGGVPSQVASDVDSPPAISWDGKTAAFIRFVPKDRLSSLIAVDLTKSPAEERIVATRSGTERFAFTGPSWSPDGRSIAAAAFATRYPDRMYDILIVDAVSGTSKPLTETSWLWAGQTAWTSDGLSVLFPAYSRDSPNITDEIWMANVSDGKARKITTGVNGVYGLSVTKDSSSIVAVNSNRVSSLWIKPLGGDGPGRVLNKSIGDSSLAELGMDWSPDGSVVYSSAVGGQADIWRVSRDGKELKQLTNDPAADYYPVVSPDGSFIIFVSNRTGRPTLWRMNSDGSGAKEIATVQDISSPSLSPDEKWVYFSGRKENGQINVLWKTPADGGDASQLTDAPTLSPQLSPDGKYIVCFYPLVGAAGPGRPPLRPTILSADGFAVIRQISDAPDLPFGPLYWAADSSGFMFTKTDNGVTNIWLEKMENDQRVQLTNFPTDEIFRFKLSPDGKDLAFEKGFKVNDVLLVTAN